VSRRHPGVEWKVGCRTKDQATLRRETPVFLVAGDHLLKGEALNAVQIAEVLLK